MWFACTTPGGPKPANMGKFAALLILSAALTGFRNTTSTVSRKTLGARAAGESLFLTAMASILPEGAISCSRPPRVVKHPAFHELNFTLFGIKDKRRGKRPLVCTLTSPMKILPMLWKSIPSSQLNTRTCRTSFGGGTVGERGTATDLSASTDETVPPATGYQRTRRCIRHCERACSHLPPECLPQGLHGFSLPGTGWPVGISPEPHMHTL